MPARPQLEPTIVSVETNVRKGGIRHVVTFSDGSEVVLRPDTHQTIRLSLWSRRKQVRAIEAVIEKFYKLPF